MMIIDLYSDSNRIKQLLLLKLINHNYYNLIIKVKIKKKPLNQFSL